jgi:hypothetical protein
MNIIFLSLAYVASVFATRWMNKQCYKMDDGYIVAPIIWFIPLANVCVWSVVYLSEVFKIDRKGGWFTGKNW